MVLAWSRKSNLWLAETTSYECKVSFEDGGCRVSPRFYFFIFDMN